MLTRSNGGPVLTSRWLKRCPPGPVVRPGRPCRPPGIGKPPPPQGATVRVGKAALAGVGPPGLGCSVSGGGFGGLLVLAVGWVQTWPPSAIALPPSLVWCVLALAVGWVLRLEVLPRYGPGDEGRGTMEGCCHALGRSSRLEREPG
jgi:hypothetical protein